MPTFHTSSLESFESAVQEITHQFQSPTLILLTGDLGAGKTKFVEYFVKSRGGENVSSPTFTLHQKYSIPKNMVHHFDLYRVESEAEMETTGLWDVLNEKKGFVFVEWPKDLPQKIPGWHVVSVQIDVDAQNERTIHLSILN